MNPHFIFNALNSIGSYITNKDGTTAKNYLNKFSGLMRETLENSHKETITLKEDFEILKTYLDIERKRFSEGFDFKLKIDSELDPENILVPPMMLQPFVENSIWHGISGLNYKGVLEIEVKKEDDKLLYAIDDNGIGRKKSNKNNKGYKKQSLGIKITKDRIEILNKKKKIDGSLKIIDKEVGTRVELRLPIEKEFSDD
jgi:LytS/YehU family sensor histidine kinase